MSGGKKHVRCAIPSCLESQRSLYHLPKDQQTRREWLEFVFNYNVPDTFSPHMLVCCQHFESACFANEAQYNAGFASKLLLLPGAVPTIDLPGAIRTIDIHGAILDLRCPPAAHVQVPTRSTSPQPAAASRRVAAACQTEPVQCRSTATQLSHRTLPPNYRSIGTQTISIGPDPTSSPSKATRPAKKPRIVVKEEAVESSIEAPEPQDASNNPVGSGPSLTSPPSHS